MDKPIPQADEPIRYRGKKIVRLIGVVILALCLVMIAIGFGLGTDQLDPKWQLVFWGLCILLPMVAILIAMVDIMLIGRATRIRRMKLFRETFSRPHPPRESESGKQQEKGQARENPGGNNG